RQHHGFVLSWLYALVDRGALLVNPPQQAYVGQLKPYHTLSLLRAGLPMPKTILTSDPIEAARFLLETPQAVYKPVMGGASARLVDRSVLDRLEQVTRHPAIFQEYIAGDNIRVTLTEKKILSAVRIPSDAVDFRDGSGYAEGKTKYESWPLPKE